MNVLDLGDLTNHDPRVGQSENGWRPSQADGAGHKLKLSFPGLRPSATGRRSGDDIQPINDGLHTHCNIHVLHHLMDNPFYDQLTLVLPRYPFYTHLNNHD